MKEVTCAKCGQRTRIPDDKHIRFNCPNPGCQKKYEYKDGEPVRSNRFKFLIPTLAILLASAGSSFTYLFPLPLVTGTAWFAWWFFRNDKTLWKHIVANLSLSTAIGLSLLLIIQLILNYIDNGNSDKIPGWLLKLDDFLIWSRLNLENITEISFSVYAFIIVVLLFLSFKRPDWKPVTKFASMEGWVGKLTAILIVITSFTFFSESAISNSVDHGYYKHYKLAYREKLKQERKKLIADAIRKQMEATDTTGFSVNISSFYNELKEISFDQTNPSDEARQDVEAVMLLEGELKTKDTDFFNPNWNGSTQTIDENWKIASKEWATEDLQEHSIAEKEIQTEVLSQSRRRTFVETTLAEKDQATKFADEAVEALKSISSKLYESIIPGGNELLAKYIEEIINTAAAYAIDAANVNKIVEQFFSDIRKIGRVDFFARVGSFWNGVTAKRKTEAQRIAELERQRLEDERLKIEQERLANIEAENSVLAKKIEDRISLETFDADRSRYPDIGSYQSESVDVFVKEQIIDLMTNKNTMTTDQYNQYLKSNYNILQNDINGKSLLSIIEKGGLNIFGIEAGICPCCGLPLAFPKCLCKL